MAKIQPVNAGDVISEGLLNRIVDQFERFANLKSNSPYIRLWDGPYGKSIALALPQQTWALLSGASSPYSFTEVRDGPGGTWVSMPTGDSGTANVYEINGKAGLAGKVVPITWTAAGDWRFSWIGYSCLWTFVTRDSCTFARVPGSLVSVSQGGIEIATCTTDGVVISLTMGSPGTGYTSAPSLAITGGGGSGATGTLDMELENITRTSGGSGYTDGSYTGTFTGGGGSGGTFSFTVSGGVVAAFMFITARGSGYTSLPTPDFSSAGPGTGATATVRLRMKSVTLTAGGSGYTSNPTVAITGGGGSLATATAVAQAQCVLNVPAGDYDVVVTPPPGAPYDGYSDTLTHTCGQTTTVTFPLDPDSVCGNGCGPCTIYPKVLTVTWSDPVLGAPFTAPDDVLTLGASIGGFLTWYGTIGYADPYSGFGGTARLVVQCSSAGGDGFGIANKNDAQATPNQAFGNLSGAASISCLPFSAIDGTTSASSGYHSWDVAG